MATGAVDDVAVGDDDVKGWCTLAIEPTAA